MQLDFIPTDVLKWGALLGVGGEAPVCKAWYLGRPVAVKGPVSKDEVEMNLHSGTPCPVTQQLGAWATLQCYSLLQRHQMSCSFRLLKLLSAGLPLVLTPQTCTSRKPFLQPRSSAHPGIAVYRLLQ